MAKRHHSSKKMHHKAHHSPVPNVVHGEYHMRDHEQYAGKEESKKMMARDGGMIREDHNAPCLLPRQVIDRDWPRAHNYSMGMVVDLFDGAQEQLHEDYKDLGREMNPKKY